EHLVSEPNIFECDCWESSPQIRRIDGKQRFGANGGDYRAASANAFLQCGRQHPFLIWRWTKTYRDDISESLAPLVQQRSEIGGRCDGWTREHYVS
ncbi:MAG TPA: hypothetical protein VFG91_07410, partial [Woeseiaceae bacterium]|nr:hypothetical protein [Woeseiaceae bacterium]